MKINLEQNKEMESTTCPTKPQKITVNGQLLTEKHFQIEKDSGVFDRLSENFSVYQSGSTSRSPSVCSGLQMAPTSANSTSSSAYASVTASCYDSSRQRSEAAARSAYSDRVPHHPKVTNALPSELCSVHARSPSSLVVPTTFSHSRPRSREGSSTSLKSDYSSSDVGRYLYDVESDRVFEKRRLLGKGGFARVYEVSEVDKEGRTLSETTMAAKIISKSRLSQPHQREKVDIEVELMTEARGHPNVLNLLDSFEDENCICIMVELCRKKSLAQYLRRKQYLAETEVSFIMHQAVSGLMHLHNKGIIHRDLKLGNILLTDDMQVKIGDFGLATRLEWERKKTICGTPNFIAPEVLQRQGHGTEADIWALGCLLYTLLVGKPPFETASLRDTYRCIMKNSYRIPSTVSSEAADLISWMLSHKPKARPTLSEIAVHPFFLKHLNVLKSLRKPQDGNIFFKSGEDSRKSSHASVSIEKSLANTSRPTPGTSLVNNDGSAVGKEQFGRNAVKRFASRIYQKLNKATGRSGLKESKKLAKKINPMREVNVPEGANTSEVTKIPQTWVNKWVDYSNRYGFGYQLVSGKICVLFNDDKHIALLPDGKTMEYSSKESAKPIRFSIEAVPTCLSKYAAILQNFTTYMDRNLRPSKDVDNYSEETDHVRLLRWYRTTEYVAMCFNDGTLQINFTHNHVKVNISSLHNASSIRIALVNPEREMKVYSGHECLAVADSEMRKRFEIIHQLFHSFFADADCSTHPFCGICHKL